LEKQVLSIEYLLLYIRAWNFHYRDHSGLKAVSAFVHILVVQLKRSKRFQCPATIIFSEKGTVISGAASKDLPWYRYIVARMERLLWICRKLLIRTISYEIIQGCRETGKQGYRETGIQGYRDTGIQNMLIELQRETRYKVNRIQRVSRNFFLHIMHQGSISIH